MVKKQFRERERKMKSLEDERFWRKDLERDDEAIELNP